MTNTTFSMTTNLSAETITTSVNIFNTTTSMAIMSTSLFQVTSPLIVLIWFEIIAACITYGLGFIGNLLSLIIFSSQNEFRNVSTGIFFLLMTISNTIHLWTLTTEFLGAFNVYIYSNVFVQCRLNYFIQNVSRAVSTYLAIGTALDRLIRSEFPMRSRIICTRRNALKFGLICLIISSILFSFWFCPLNTLNPVTGTCYSGQSPIFNFFLGKISIPVRFIIVCVIPVIIMASANIRVLLNIRQSRRRVEQQSKMNTNSTTVGNGLKLRRMTPLDRMLLYMMLANVGTFIVTQIPFHTYTIKVAFQKDRDVLTILMIRTLLLVWSSIYFGVGFYLNCLASPLFREKLLMMMKNIINRRMHR